MNSLEYFRDALAQFSTTPVWVQLLTKVTLLLAVTWALHFSVARANPRWRVLLWRSATVCFVLLVACMLGLPGLDIRVGTRKPVAMEPVATRVPSLDRMHHVAPESAGRLQAFREPSSVPAAAPIIAIPRQESIANRTATGRPVESLASMLSWPLTLLIGWGIGAVLLMFRLAMGCAGLSRLLRASPAVSDEIVAEVGRVATTIACRRAVRVRRSAHVAVPFICGATHPVLVLPDRMCLPEYRSQLPGVIAHELAHVASGDFAWNVALQTTTILLWFHPLAWSIGSAHRAACDAVCDAVAASYLGDVAAYCRTLAQVALQGAASFPALGLAMAQTCDVRRRIAAVQRKTSATALGRRAALAASSIGLLTTALLAGARFAIAESPIQLTENQPAASAAKQSSNDQTVKSDSSKPISMSVEVFGRLSAAEQRAVLVSAFQRHLDRSGDFYYEMEESTKLYEARNAVRGKRRENDSDVRDRRRHWRLGDSFRIDSDTYENPGDAEPSSCSSIVSNATEGVARLVYTDKKGKPPLTADVQYASPDSYSDQYSYWFESRDPHPRPGLREFIFPYLIAHREQFEIKAPVADGMVQLIVPWQPEWAAKPGGTRNYILDPEKGFLPVRCDARYDEAAENGSGPCWRIETLRVQECKLVGDCWMPTKLTDETASSTLPESIDVCEMKIFRIEFGKVKPSDLFVPFISGMEVRDLIEGATYTADAQGNAVNVKFNLEKDKPPEGWSINMPRTMTSKITPADRAKLAAQWKAFMGKYEQQRQVFKTALAIMRSSTPLDERIEAGLNVLRTQPDDIDPDYKLWASILRELILIGKPAVPKLTAELDRTEDDGMLRDLGFVLRGIGDPRAVPALIRAIPRLANPTASDCGSTIESDPTLGQFMHEHSFDYRGKPGETVASLSIFFSYGRPFYEIMSALEKLAGGLSGWRELRFVSGETGSWREPLQRKLFVELAKRWADRWSKNWPKHVKNEGEAQLDQTAKTLEAWSQTVAKALNRPRQTEFPSGPNVVAGNGEADYDIHSFVERPGDGFCDLDTGRLPNPPADLLKKSSGHEPSSELLAWAEREGVDLINIKLKSRDGRWYYAFQPLGMKMWRVENSRFDSIETELRTGKQIKLPLPWGGPLAQIDEKTGQYDAKLIATFLFITKEGTCGVLQIKSPLNGGGYSSGGLSYKFLYEKDAKR